jgi:CRISPR/Cas system-associated exonuclease Cas4 (RecB family)
MGDKGWYDYYIRINRLMDVGRGVYEIHEYRTGKTLLEQEALDKDRQLGMYAQWVSREFEDFKHARLVWHFLAFNQERSSIRTRVQLEQLQRDILEDIEEIEITNVFPPKISPVCQWCLYRNICPVWQGHSGSIS